MRQQVDQDDKIIELLELILLEMQSIKEALRNLT